MSRERKPKPSRKEHRPLQFQMPDVRTPEFAAEAHRQSLAVSRSPHAKEDMDFVESISELFEDVPQPPQP